MAKKIIMIAPFDVLTGNLSGQQELQYAENNNPAYEAPNGSQGARNYKTRYVGARRADGTTYFSVRQKNTAVLNARTRITMAILGSVAAMEVTIAANTSMTSQLRTLYNYTKSQGNDISYKKWLNNWLKDMLRYKRASVTIHYTAPGMPSVVINNPYALDNANAMVINQIVWRKFAPVLAFDSADQVGYITVDGRPYMVNIDPWGSLKTHFPNANYVASLFEFDIKTDAPAHVWYNGQDIWLADVKQEVSSDIQDGGKYTTVEPEP